MARLYMIPLILVVASWAIAAHYWPTLPPVIPVHWGIHGEPNGWMAMPWAALVGPVLTTVLAGAFGGISRRASSPEVGATMAAMGAAFGCLVTFLVLDTAARPGQQLDVRLLLGGMGLMFLVLGNYLPKVRRNRWIGIRTPWTLGNDEVWYRTHRVAGRLMVAAGLVVLLASRLAVEAATVVAIAALVGMGLGSAAYSYRLHREVTNGGGRA